MKSKENNLEKNISRLVKLAGDSNEPGGAFADSVIKNALDELKGTKRGRKREGSDKFIKVNWKRTLPWAAMILIVCGIGFGILISNANKTGKKAESDLKMTRLPDKLSKPAVQDKTKPSGVELVVEETSLPTKFDVDEAYESLKVSKNLDAFLRQSEPNYNIADMLLAARAAKPMFMERRKPVPKKLLQEPERTVRVRASEALTKLGVEEDAVARKKIKKDAEQVVESDKPIAHWAFEEGRGSTVYDWAGNNHGTIHGAKWTTGRIGGALSFDGVDDYVSILDARDPQAYTLTAWVHPKSASTQGIIVRTSTRGPAREWSHQLLISSSGKFVHYLYCSDGTPLAVTSDRPIVVDTWYHVAAVAENNGNMRLYVNGQEEGTAQGIRWLWNGGDRWYIGSNASGLEYFKGLIDEVAIYNRALSAEEIRQLYRVKAVEPSAWLVTLTPLGVMFEFRPPAGSSGWVDMELYEHGGEMLAEFSCPHAGEPIQIWLAEPVDEKDPAKYYLRYRIRITAAPLPKWRVVGLSRMPRTTNKTSDKNKPSTPVPAKDMGVKIPMSHGPVKDGLAAFLMCHRARFKIGEPIPLNYGIINVGPGADVEHSHNVRVWFFATRPWDPKNFVWLEVTGPDGKNIRYHGGAIEWRAKHPVDKNSVFLRHRQFIGTFFPDLGETFELNKPGTYKVRWGYNPWFEGGPWTGELMSNEVQFEIVK